MKNHFLPLLNICCFLFGLYSTSAQNPYFINYDIEDGLPSSEVYDIHAAKDGRIFITTDRGVAIYNGYHFTNYSKKDGLASNTNFQIYEDTQNRLWLNGMEVGLSIYEDDQFKPFPGNQYLEDILMNRWVEDLVFDENGIIYFPNNYARKTSVYSFSQKDNSRDFSPPKKADKEFKKVLNTEFTFYGNQSIAFFRSKKSHYIWKLMKFKNGWLGFEDQYLFFFDQNGQLIERYEWGQKIDALYVDTQDHLWVCTFSGLLLFPNGQLDQTPKRYFQDLGITNMCQDFEGNYWLSTLTNGVLFVPSFAVNIFKSVTTDLNTERILTAIPLEHQVVFSTSESRIFTIDKNAQTKWLKKKRFQGEQLRFANVFDNQIYYRADHILTEKSRNDIQLSSLSSRAEYANLSFLHYYATFLKKLRNGNYITSNIRGLQFILNDTLIQPPSLLNKRINIVEEHTDGTIWIGTEKGMYYISNYQYDKIIPAFENRPNLQGRIQDFNIDQYQNLWVATIGEGLSYQTKTKGYPIEGLNSHHVNTIYASNDSLLWIGTNEGLYRLTYQSGEDTLKVIELKSYSNIDGLSSNYINDVTYWNDYLWLATNRGVTYLNLSDLDHSYPPIPIKIDRLLANNILQSNNGDHSLQYNENDIYIHYTGISYRKDHQAFYRYRLIKNGQKQSWFYTNERNVRYNNLGPGQYTFEVMAQGKSGVWSTAPASTSFTIRLHFTQTIWFCSLLIFLVAAGIVAFFKFQTKRLQQKEDQKRLLQEAEYRTREAELVALRSQMNPHFVFNALNSIQHYIFKKDVNTANHFLGKFSRLMRNSLDFSKRAYISLDQELAFLNNYLDLEVLRFPNKFTYHFDIEPCVRDQGYLVPSLLFQPVLENAIKHAFRDIDYPGVLEIKVQEISEQNALKVTIKDNGLGLPSHSIDNENNHKSLGLSIVQNRIDLLQKDHESKVAAFEITNWKKIDPMKKGVQVDFIIPIKFKIYD